jgi:serine/threonine protein kinase
MADARLCPQCGAELPDGAAAGLCFRCLLPKRIENAAHTPSFANDATLAPRAADPKVREPSSNPQRFGDYEILEEIARGGMGVVYKARQVCLDRIVALKMILAGQLAAESDVERFYSEARAAANLQHPNIVAIHEVGQHEGQHYFSMDLVEGKSLASLVEAGPLPVSQAVAYLKSIAEAIHYAHQHGILHRDLKPSNILIDAFDQPRITDFGIAKRIGKRDVASASGTGASADSSLTSAGEVLGTPSYMPPEQIDGDAAQLSPASDVYSLGAVLYELLTGRPPFKANSVRDTLLQVIQSQPARIRRLNRRVPRPLEQICLKCLQKEPKRRYHSAAALVDDLERFELGQDTQAAADYKALAPRIILGSLLACLLFCCGGPALLIEWFPKRFGFTEPLSNGLGKTIETVRSSVQSNLQLLELARAWRPPAEGSGTAALFPDHIGSFALSGHDEKAGIIEFRIDLPGWRANYKSGAKTIELFMYRASLHESDVIFERVNSLFNDESVRVAGTNSSHYAYKFAGQIHSGTFIWIADRLLLARTQDGAGTDEFLRSYLRATAPVRTSVQLATGGATTQDDQDQSTGVVTVSYWPRTRSFFALAIIGVLCAAFWKVFSKAGLRGWGSLIPVYNLVLWMRLGGKPGWWAIWLVVPFVNLVIYTIVTFEVAKNFGKGVAYTLGLLLCPPLFYIFLGLGKAQYNPTLLRLRRQIAAG